MENVGGSMTRTRVDFERDSSTKWCMSTPKVR